ncbi:hypothetical protein [Bacillus toyonensis]|uniref:hypothetical protein n=1 Tax=Bacillus toyonensis TaxID=155322 RepID=UPI000BEB3708|nr:hypothetical protein [Bacillus toyonensis]PED17413.1 hypothetical protein CON63_26275 [Bacillus toyonensis]PEM92711.1 hypothetical protein CN629_17525 [Bacillus toyonensis]
MEGYSTVSIYNCHDARRSINIWVDNGLGWEKKMILDHQYDKTDYCPVGEPYVLELQDELLHHIVCVDEGGEFCGVDDPDILGCRKYEITILGSSTGPAHPDIIVP